MTDVAAEDTHCEEKGFLNDLTCHFYFGSSFENEDESDEFLLLTRASKGVGPDFVP